MGVREMKGQRRVERENLDRERMGGREMKGQRTEGGNLLNLDRERMDVSEMKGRGGLEEDGIFIFPASNSPIFILCNKNRNF